jgi:hypothetical protein
MVSDQRAATASRRVPQTRERGMDRAQAMQGPGTRSPKRWATASQPPMMMATRGRLGEAEFSGSMGVKMMKDGVKSEMGKRGVKSEK